MMRSFTQTTNLVSVGIAFLTISAYLATIALAAEEQFEEILFSSEGSRHRLPIHRRNLLSRNDDAGGVNKDKKLDQITSLLQTRLLKPKKKDKKKPDKKNLNKNNKPNKDKIAQKDKRKDRSKKKKGTGGKDKWDGFGKKEWGGWDGNVWNDCICDGGEWWRGRLLSDGESEESTVSRDAEVEPEYLSLGDITEEGLEDDEDQEDYEEDEEQDQKTGEEDEDNMAGEFVASMKKSNATQSLTELYWYGGKSSKSKSSKSKSWGGSNNWNWEGSSKHWGWNDSKNRWGGDSKKKGCTCNHKKLTKWPTQRPSPMPSRRPSYAPSRKPSRRPSQKPSKKPTMEPTRRPTKAPTNGPTNGPTSPPSSGPTPPPTAGPSPPPTPGTPTPPPTSAGPTPPPTPLPSPLPTPQPSSPTPNPTTPSPTPAPTPNPTLPPAPFPTDNDFNVPASDQITTRIDCTPGGGSCCSSGQFGTINAELTEFFVDGCDGVRYSCGLSGEACAMTLINCKTNPSCDLSCSKNCDISIERT